MRVSTRKGDTGSTQLLRGERVPKHHQAIEAGGTLDEANSLLGLARASSKEKRIKRIILQVQKHLFIIGAEISVPKGKGKPPKRTISEADVKWLEKLIEGFEEALALPPGFVAFGQEESASHMDVARTSIRKAERIAVKMKNEGLVENFHILKYLNRLSDLVFLLASFEEKNAAEREKLNRSLFPAKWADPAFRRWTILTVAIILPLVITIILLLLFHKAAPNFPARTTVPSVADEQSSRERSPQPDSQSLPVSSKPGQISDGEDGAIMRLIPEGSLSLPEGWGTAPGAEVKIAPFYMDETQVTNHQYVEFLNQEISNISVEAGVVRAGTEIWLMLGEVLEGYEPIIFKGGRFRVKNPGHSSCPVVRVTAYGGAAYARFYGRRLPTAVEWLYALVKGMKEKIKSVPDGQSTAKQGSVNTSMAGMMDMEELEMADEPAVEPPGKGPYHFPYPVILYTPDKFGLRGLNRNVGEWVVRETLTDRDTKSAKNFAVMGRFKDSQDHNSSLPQPLPRQPWEAFEKVGFRCVRSAVSPPG